MACFALPLPSLGGLLGYLLIGQFFILLTDWLNGRLSGGRGILSFFLNNRDSTHSSSSETPVSQPFLPTSSLNFWFSTVTIYITVTEWITFLIVSDSDCEGCPQVPEPDNGRPDGKKWNSKDRIFFVGVRNQHYWFTNFKNNKFFVFRFLNIQLIKILKSSSLSFSIAKPLPVSANV